MEYIILSENYHRLSKSLKASEMGYVLYALGYLNQFCELEDEHLASGLFKYQKSPDGKEVLMILESKTTEISFDISYWEAEQFYGN